MLPTCLDRLGTHRRFLRSPVPFASASSCHILHTSRGEIDLGFRRFLGLLDETVQQDHVTLADAENRSRNSIAVERASHFPQPLFERRAMRTPDRPTKLDLLNILADRVPIGSGNPRIH